MNLDTVLVRQGGRPARSAVPYSVRIARLNRALNIPKDYGRTRQFKLQKEATKLVAVGENPKGGGVQMTPRAAAAWFRMKAAAAEDGLTLVCLSGFRSVARQTAIIKDRLAAGEDLKTVLTWIASPGYSEHHTGKAIDIGAPDDEPLEETFEKTAEYRWLRRHAGKFGFRLSYPRKNPHGIGYEPWHWFYCG